MLLLFPLSAGLIVDRMIAALLLMKFLSVSPEKQF
jgi:hypothetical protein